MNPPLKKRLSMAWHCLLGLFQGNQVFVDGGIQGLDVANNRLEISLPDFHDPAVMAKALRSTLRPIHQIRCPVKFEGSGSDRTHFTLGDYYVHLISIIDHGKGQSVLYRRAHDPKGTVRRMGLQAWSKKAKPA